MLQPVAKVPLAGYLSFTYNVLLYSGLIHFKYNKAEDKFKHSKFNFMVTQIVYGVLFYVYALRIALPILVQVQPYVLHSGNSTQAGESAIDTQESVLFLLNITLRFTKTSLHARNFLQRGGCLLPVINEMWAIFKRLRARTDSQIYFDASFMLLAILKMYLIALYVHRDLCFFLPHIRLLDYLFPFSYLLCAMAVLTYMYTQLVLICFYMKMNEFLADPTNWRGTRQLQQLLEEFIATSSRIHRVKRKLDWFYTTVFVASYIGLFADIYHIYEILKLLLYHTSSWCSSMMVLIHLPVCVAASFDVFLLGRLSDVLSGMEDAFKWRVVVLVDQWDLHKEKSLHRGVEMMLHEHWMRGVSTNAFERIRLDQQFAFSYFLNVIIINSLTCLQYYASWVVYAEL